MKTVSKEYVVYRLIGLGAAGLTIEPIIFDSRINSFRSEEDALNAMIAESIMYEGLLILPKFTIE